MQKSLYRLFSADLSTPALLIGYLFGMFIPLIFGQTVLAYAPVDMTSEFISDSGGFIRVFCAQAIYPASIFLLGFIPCARIPCALVLFARSALASYSSLALAFSGVSDGLYLLHTLCGASLLAVCWAISKCVRDARDFPAVYTCKFLFFSGIFLIILFCRSVALAFI